MRIEELRRTEVGRGWEEPWESDEDPWDALFASPLSDEEKSAQACILDKMDALIRKEMVEC